MKTGAMAPKVVVIVYGGLIQEVYADKPTEMVVLDYDQDGITSDDQADDPWLFPLPKSHPNAGESFVRAYVADPVDLSHLPDEYKPPCRHALDLA